MKKELAGFIMLVLLLPPLGALSQTDILELGWWNAPLDRMIEVRDHLSTWLIGRAVADLSDEESETIPILTNRWKLGTDEEILNAIEQLNAEIGSRQPSRMAEEETPEEETKTASRTPTFLEELMKRRASGQLTRLYYNDVIRAPAQYDTMYGIIAGNVIQVVKNEKEYGEYMLREGTRGSKLWYVSFHKSSSTVRVQENDYVTFYGICSGIYDSGYNRYPFFIAGEVK